MQTKWRIQIAKRIAKELGRESVVNLGVGIPTLILPYLDPNKIVFLQSENGMLGMGLANEIDMDCISASKQAVGLELGASIFSSSDSFAMIRGGHIDIAVLGALQVSETGEIANWAATDSDILGVGGAMDLVTGAKKIIVAMLHVTKEGVPKIVKKLTYPTSGVRTANMIVTEKAVFIVENGQLVLTEIAPTSTLEEIQQTTEADFIVK